MSFKIKHSSHGLKFNIYSVNTLIDHKNFKYILLPINFIAIIVNMFLWSYIHDEFRKYTSLDDYVKCITIKIYTLLSLSNTHHKN